MAKTSCSKNEFIFIPEKQSKLYESHNEHDWVNSKIFRIVEKTYDPKRGSESRKYFLNQVIDEYEDQIFTEDAAKYNYSTLKKMTENTSVQEIYNKLQV